MNRLVACLAVVLSVLGGFTARAGAQAMAFYDLFDAPTIDPAKWMGFEFGPAAPGANSEVFRRIVSGQLQLLLRSSGLATSDTGTTGASNRLRIGHRALLDGSPVIQIMEARMRVVDASVGACPDNLTASRVRAQIFGVFFNDGTGNNLAGDRTGDISAGLQKVIDSVSGNRVEAFLNRCTDAACTTTTNFAVNNPGFTRSWSIGDTDLMRVRWDPAGNRFQFMVNAATGPHGSQSIFVTYNPPDTLKPKRFFNDFIQSFTMANCLDGPVPAFMDLRIDNVRLDQAAVTATGP